MTRKQASPNVATLRAARIPRTPPSPRRPAGDGPDRSGPAAAAGSAISARSVLDTGIERGVGQIDQEIDYRKDHRTHDYSALNEGEVALLEGLKRKVAATGPVEDRLDYDGAAQHIPRLQAD